MDDYGVSSTTNNVDYFPIDDLLDLTNEDLFSSSSTTSSSTSSTDHSLALDHNYHSYRNSLLDFNPLISLPNDDVAELEWLSRFVDDSFNDIPSCTVNIHTLSSTNAVAQTAPNKVRAKRSRVPPEEGGGVRRCSHCASEKTPQWRMGPLGPKTLCNACGVRFKSGRLVPEYRPASSPTFVLAQHSNSHRKVIELRRKKEEIVRQQLPPHQNFGIC